MPQDPLRTEERDRDGVRILRFEGGLIRDNSEALRERLDGLVEAEFDGVALDFEAVDYMDSSALGACAAVAKRLSRGGTRPFVVFGANRTVEKMWKLIGLERLIPLAPDEEAALARIREAASD